LQLPAVFLASLGLCKAATQPENRLRTILKCLIILIIPFFLLEFLNCLLVFVLQEFVSKSLVKTNLTWFLGKTDQRRALGIKMARAFCGTVFQLLYQLVLVLGYTPWSSVRFTQILSIGSSILTIIKTATEMIMFKEEDEEEEQEERTKLEVLIDFFRKKI